MIYMLGKLPAQEDARNFPMKMLLVKESIPDQYNFDLDHPCIPTPMFANDKHGCCVISGRGHQTIRFELLESGFIPGITDAEIIRQWRYENGNTDNGLYILQSIKLWRSEGWVVGGNQYRIKAFAEVNPQNVDEVKRTIYNDLGVMVGLAMPDTAMKEFDKGLPWIDTKRPKDQYNGHCVYIVGYDKDFITCITWGKHQNMSWDFFTKYCDEAYGTIDAANEKNINVAALNELLIGVE